jgi:hypothetical protein
MVATSYWPLVGATYEIITGTCDRMGHNWNICHNWTKCAKNFVSICLDHQTRPSTRHLIQTFCVERIIGYLFYTVG